MSANREDRTFLRRPEDVCVHCEAIAVYLNTATQGSEDLVWRFHKTYQKNFNGPRCCLLSELVVFKCLSHLKPV